MEKKKSSNQFCHHIQITYRYCSSYKAACIGDTCNTHCTRITQNSGNSHRPNSTSDEPSEPKLLENTCKITEIHLLDGWRTNQEKVLVQLIPPLTFSNADLTVQFY